MVPERQFHRFPVKWPIIAIAIVVTAVIMAVAVFIDATATRQQALQDLSSSLSTSGHGRAVLAVQAIDQLRGDAAFLANVPPVEGIARAAEGEGGGAQDQTPLPLWTRQLQSIFYAYEAANPSISELRLVSVANGGQELVRVHQGDDGPVVIPDDQLKKIGYRDFVQATLTMRPGEVYVSDLTLSRDGTAIRVPHVPTLRAATPVFGPDGKQFGLVEVSLNTESLFASLNHTRAGFQTYLTNSAGDYLMNPDASKNFGFDLGHRYRWSEDFSLISNHTVAAPPSLQYRSAAGIVHAVGFRIDLHDPHRALTLIEVASDAPIQAAVKTALTQMALGLSIGALVVGALLYLYWVNLRNRRLVMTEQARLAAIVESSNDAVIGTAIEGAITDWNPAAERMFGYSREEAIGRTVLELIVPPEYRSEEAEIVERVRRGEVVPPFYTRRRCSDGSLRHVGVTVSPILSARGQVVGAAKTLRDVTAQTESQLELQEAQSRLQLTTQAAGIGIWEWDMAGQKMIWDDTMYELYGSQRGEFSGSYEDWLKYIYSDDLQVVLRAAEASVATGAVQDTDFRIITKSGEIRDIRSKTANFFDEQNRSTRVLGTNFDVTAEKQRERRIEELNATLEQLVIERTERLLALSELHRAILAQAPYAIIALDTAGIVTLINTEGERVFGYSAAELIGNPNPPIGIDPAEAAARATELSAELGRKVEPRLDVIIAKVRPGVPEMREWTAIDRKGRRFPVLMTAAALQGVDGLTIGYLLILVDLSERREQERQLAKSEARYRVLVEDQSELVSLMTPDGKFTFVNHALADHYGVKPSDLIGTYMYNRVPESARPAIRRNLEVLCAIGSERSEWPMQSATGEIRWIAWISRALKDQNGQVTEIHSVGRDITENKEAEARLEKLNAELEVRTEEAEAATLAKGQFLANMSHEIRSPMNAILGMLLLLQRTDLSANQRGYAANAYMATRSLLGLLNDILDFSKIEAGRIALESVPFSIDGLMRDLSGIVSASMGGKEIDLVFSLDKDLPAQMLGDSFRLRQVLLNLAGNAVKFTEAGEVVISARVVSQNDARAEIEFSVRDSGIGIAPEKLTEIFEGFRQGESSMARRYGGTGLGLAISQRLVALMGGALSVESELGVGSRFHFTVAFDKSEETADTRWIAPSLALPQDRPLQVLIVDDNQTARDSLLVMVESLGWHGECAAGGLEALELVRSRSARIPYDIVLLDWKMPDFDGFDFARRMRGLPLGTHAPIIILVTAYGRDAVVGRMKNEPELINGILVKPVTASMLFDAMIDVSAGRMDSGSSGSVPANPKRLSGFRLLVVDDNLMNQQIAFELLSDEGAEVAIAGDGLSGVKAALNVDPPFDAVLMDIQMPEMDGYEAARALRTHERLNAMPIIAMTANAMAAEKAACLAAGMNGHVAKPIDLDLLVATIFEKVQKSWPPADRVNQVPSSSIEPLSADEPPANESAVGGAGLIDLDLALKRLGGSQELYARIADRFIIDSAELERDLASAAQEHDRLRAITALHTLRGIAGAVGAGALAGLAGELETGLKTGILTIDLADSVRTLGRLLTDTNNALRNVIAGVVLPGSRVPPGEAGTASLAAGLDELEHLLRHADMRAITVFRDLRQRFDNDYGSQLMALAVSVDRLDFAVALADCRALRTRLS